METTTAVATVSRDITIFSGQGKNNYTINFSGVTTKDLRDVLRKEGYNIDSMKIVESVNRSTLESPTSLVPTVNHRIHLYPKSTKGGATKKAAKKAAPKKAAKKVAKAKKVVRTRKELYAAVKNAFAMGNKKADAFFNTGSNFTRKKSDELEELVIKWEKKYGVHTGGNEASLPVPEPKDVHVTMPADKPAGKRKASVKATAVADVVDSVADHLATPNGRITSALTVLAEVKEHENQPHVDTAKGHLNKALQPKETFTEPQGNSEHAEIAKGLEGIRSY